MATSEDLLMIAQLIMEFEAVLEEEEFTKLIDSTVLDRIHHTIGVILQERDQKYQPDGGVI